MLRRALAGFKEALGPEHTDTLLTVRQLLLSSRAVCTCRGNVPALSGWTSGPKHPFALKTVDFLGDLYTRQGCLADAEKMYWRSRAGKEMASAS